LSAHPLKKSEFRFTYAAKAYILQPMSDAPKEIETLIDLMARLPGLGPRSARRAVLHLIKKRGFLMQPLANAMQEVAASARECLNCGNISTADLCPLCASEKRANGEICVVEDVADLWAMERSGVFKGRYHVLGGTLSALDAIGPNDLRIPKLLDRVASENVTEVILALNATIDGQTTAHYIADQLEARVSVTSLAQGVPIGGELDYLDDGTITAALRARKSF
jgi:recombination protein RecR